MAAEATGTRTHDWLLFATASGAPGLKLRDDSQHGLNLSISHSGDIAAVAIAPLPVGIDVEADDRVRDWLALADLIFAPEECAQLRSVEESRRRDVFHRYWTLKEAIGKRNGTGLHPQGARAQSASACDEAEAAAITWQFDNHCVALVGERGMLINAHGIPGTAQQRFWQFDTFGFR